MTVIRKKHSTVPLVIPKYLGLVHGEKNTYPREACG